MFDSDGPAFPIALLAILAGLRLASFLVERVTKPAATPAEGPLLAPDAPGEEAVTVEALSLLEEERDGAATTTPPTPGKSARPERQPFTLLNELLDSALIAVVLVFFLIRPYVVQAFVIPSGSMRNTLREKDQLIATKYTYRLREPKRGEVVVFHAPELALKASHDLPRDPNQKTDYVKRVIGLPGDRIRVVANDGVYVNGTRLAEPYTATLPDYDFPISPTGDLATHDAEVQNALLPLIEGGELVIPPGYLFVMGDNRNQSSDSHVWGLLDRKALVGKADLIFWPPNRAGLIQ